jgi:hypothetical protein
MRKGNAMITLKAGRNRSILRPVLFGLSLLTLPWAATAQTITVGSIVGQVGTSVWFDVTLDPQGKSIAATQSDIGFDAANIPIGTCTRNQDLDKDLSWSRLPTGCSGAACETVRGIILSTENSNAILTPTVLYRCRVDIPSGATPGTYPLTIQNASASDPISNPRALTEVDGQVTVTSGGSGC